MSFSFCAEAGRLFLKSLKALFIAVACSAAVCPISNGTAAEIVELHLLTRPTAAQLTAHMNRIYRDAGSVMHKWTSPIKYQVFGLDETGLQKWRNRAATLAKFVPISEDVSGDGPTNMIVIFTDSFASIADVSIVRQAFGEPGETTAAYGTRMASEFNQHSLQDMGYKSGSIVYVVQIINTSLADFNLDLTIMQTLFFSLSEMEDSNEIRPSITNTGLLSLPEYPKFDLDFLRVLYSPDIQAGMALSNAKEVLVKNLAAH